MTDLLTLARTLLGQHPEHHLQPAAVAGQDERLRLLTAQLEQRVYQVARLTLRLRRASAALADAVDRVHRTTST